VDLAASIDQDDCRIRDASLYGVWLTSRIRKQAGDEVSLAVRLSDGAVVHLSGRVVTIRDGGLAVRTRPSKDADLVLWLHLILGELASSPLHADADPFGPLFR
jgi:hypothetical protein